MNVLTLLKVLRFAPLKIDGTIYFSVMPTKPAGGLRQRGGTAALSYVDPFKNEGFHREIGEFAGRITWPTHQELQTLLDHFCPGFYRTVPIYPAGHENDAICLVLVRSRSTQDGLSDRDYRGINMVVDTTPLNEQDPILHLASEMVDSTHLSRRFVETFDLYNRCCR